MKEVKEADIIRAVEDLGGDRVNVVEVVKRLSGGDDREFADMWQEIRKMALKMGQENKLVVEDAAIGSYLSATRIRKARRGPVDDKELADFLNRRKKAIETQGR